MEIVDGEMRNRGEDPGRRKEVVLALELSVGVGIDGHLHLQPR